MSFKDLSSKRFSVRSYKDTPVEKEKLDAVLESGRLAPTAGNTQSHRIKVVTGADSLAKIDEATPCRFGAPLVLVVCYDRTACWKRKFDGALSGEVDASIVTTHMMLQAEDLGLGSVWVMFFDPEIVRKNFDLPDDLIPVALLPLGYPAENATPADRHWLRHPIEKIAF
jgi:nitroreductase